MAESVLYFVLDKLGHFIQQETTLLSGVGDDVVFIKEELESIMAFLRVAETFEEVNPQLRTWLQQVRNLAFDIEDFLDEFKLFVVHDPKENCVRKTIQAIKNIKYRRHMAIKIQGFKSRAINISERHQRYNLNIQSQGSSSTTRNSTWQKHREDALLLEEADLVGIDAPKMKLINWLVEEDPIFKVISVVGMGGLGKTTLVKKVYDDVVRQKHFRSHAWVTVSQSFKLEELLRNLIFQLYKESLEERPQEMEIMDSQNLKETLRKYLQDKSYLIILDDVWNQEAWDEIKYAFPRTNNGNRVLLTTRNLEIANASRWEFKGEVYFLEPLSSQMSWQLFCKKTFQAQYCPSHLEGIAQQILKRCEGLPLAIVAISGILATKNQNTIDEWEMVKQSLGAELENDKLKSMTKILSLSYYDLPFHLKACLLYVSIYPEDYEILCPRLVRLWVAEEFVKEVEGKIIEEVAKSYLNELLHRSLLQVASVDEMGMVLQCRMHDMLREVILSKCKDQNFAMIMNEKDKIWPAKVRRLSVHNSLGEFGDKNLISGLRSLMLFGNDGFPLKSFGKDLKLLKVLDLGGTNLEIFPNEITKLYYLRYLSLNSTNVSVIPPSIKKLLNLVTLDLFGTRVTKLPITIGNLQRLCHIFLYNVEDVPASLPKVRGFDATYGIGYLHSLQVLWYIELREGNHHRIIEEIGKMSQLRELGILNLKREDGIVLCSSLDKLSHLHLLELASVDEEEILNLYNVSLPSKFLQWLTLRGRLETIPYWISSLNNLAALKLFGSRLKEDILKVIKGLPNLMHLSLACHFEGNELCFEVGGFQKLNTLWLSNLQALTRVIIEVGAMPFLEKLFIQRCAVMDSLPFGIENLSRLKLLELQDASNTLISTIDRSKEGGDLWRIEHIQNVHVFHYNEVEGKWIYHPS